MDEEGEPKSHVDEDSLTHEACSSDLVRVIGHHSLHFLHIPRYEGVFAPDRLSLTLETVTLVWMH